MIKKHLWILAAILFCGLTTGAMMACGGDDKDEESVKDSMDALCHVMVSEDVLKVADVTVHYLDAKGQEVTEPLTTTEWRKKWTTTTLPARLGVWAQMKAKTLGGASLQDNYQLKAVATAGYLFHSAKGGKWADGWTSSDPYADSEKVLTADIQSWCSKNVAAGCEVNAQGNGKPANVDFGGNFDIPFFGNAFCIWIMEKFGFTPDYCD